MNPSTTCVADAVPLLVIFALMVSAMSSARAQSPQYVPTVTGCWQASRPLYPTGEKPIIPPDQVHSGEWEWALFALRDSGRVALPLVNDQVRATWEPRSDWQLRADSVDLTVSTGLKGWKVRLAAREQLSEMKGYATYLNDAAGSSEARLRWAVTLRRTVCKPAWGARPITTRRPSL